MPVKFTGHFTLLEAFEADSYISDIRYRLPSKSRFHLLGLLLSTERTGIASRRERSQEYDQASH